MPTINIKKKQMSYVERGEGFPILFGHSFLWNKEMWNPTIEKLSKNYRCIAPDLWAHGDSEPIENAIYSVEEIAEDMMAFVRAIGLTNFVAIGLSVGGMWATHLAIQESTSLAGLVLMNTYVGSEPELTKNQYFQMIDAVEKTGEITPQLIAQMIPLFLAQSSLTAKPSLENEFKELLRSYKNEKLKTILSIGRGIFSRKSLLKQLPSISIPSLVIAGEKDLSRSVAESVEMVEMLKNSRLEVVDDAGHISNLEQPEIVNALLMDYLKSLKLSI